MSLGLVSQFIRLSALAFQNIWIKPFKMHFGAVGGPFFSSCELLGVRGSRRALERQQLSCASPQCGD